jgi:signal transduction histidine kinase
MTEPGVPTVLIVDDTPANLGVMVEALESSGYRVVVAQDGEEGLRRAKLVQPALILLDVMMPDADGFEVCRQLKREPSTRDIPVIFMTALADAGDKLSGFKAGGVDFVTKPLQIDEVMARVGTHLKLRATQRQLEERNAELLQYRDSLEQQVAERTAELSAANRRLQESYALLQQLTTKRESAREEERKRISREIHDELGQHLTALRMGISTLRMQFAAGNPALGERIHELMALADQTIQVVREVAAALRPGALDAGLIAGVEWLAAEFEKRSGIPCRLELPKIQLDLDEERATALFRIVQESLTNVARHAKATSVLVLLAQEEEDCIVEVRDNGQGFDPTRAQKKSFGLVGMRERAYMLGGEISIHSDSGTGTSIKARIPIHNVREET